MLFFILANALLVFGHVALGSNGPSTSTMVFLCGMTLIFLFNYVRKTRSSREVLCVILVTALVVLLLFYLFLPVVIDDNTLFLMFFFLFGAGFCAMLAGVVYAVDRKRVSSVIGWMAFCATALNAIPLVSY